MPPLPTSVVIFNPVAGRGNHNWPTLEKELHHRGAIIHRTEYPGHAAELARQAISQGAESVVAAGGDGTLGEVADAIIGSKQPVRLGVLPLGTGNDFARTLGLYGHPSKAISAIFEGETRRVDVGCIDCEGKSRMWLNIAGCGFDSLVAQRINSWGSRKTMRHARGLSAYLLAVLRELATYHTFEIKLQLDDEIIETRAVLCAVANAKSYGGGMCVCPDAELDDGYFDVCIIEDANRSEFLRAFPGVFAGRHITHPKVKMRRCRAFSLDCHEKIPVLADGEIVGTPPFHCHIVPRALEICVPQKRG